MELLLEAFGSLPGAGFLRESGTAYLFVNATHILGIGLILGAILPLDLRLLGLFPRVPLAVLGPFLSRVAAIGVTIAVPTGLWLFAVNAPDYVGNTAFLAKLALLALAFGNIALQHGPGGFRATVTSGVTTLLTRVLAAVSILLWLSVLLAGRWIGFM
ncbi:MAG: DUF2214 domain-containing protein [Burkholderiaceae bacterium]|nr:DUF2214 domain-containing protein [Burkholderiaceae bacterium]